MKHYYFIGIGGIGMSGLAKILISKGNTVSGSDLKRNTETQKLEELGATIFYGQNSSHMDNNIDVVIYTSAIPEANPDLVRAKELKRKIMTRPELLNEVLTTSKGIAVTGTHGKTTVSSMLSLALLSAGLDPTVIVGAEVKELSSNARLGKGDYAVAEVCEYKRAFLDVHPFGAIITNIDADHLDCYRDLDDIKAAFAKFITQIDKSGFLTFCEDDDNTTALANAFTGHLLSYGESQNAKYRIIDISSDENESHFEIIFDETSLGKFSLKVPGKHNILNAAGVIATCHHLKADLTKVSDALANFGGADRRFQILGTINGATVVDDYAHHPTEIKATLAAARSRYPEKRIIAVFQPHQHSRTKMLMNDFASSFSDADTVIIPEIYAVRDSDEDIKTVSSDELAKKINTITEGKAIFIPDFKNVVAELREMSGNNDVIITIGAGPVNQIAQDLV